MSTPSRSANSEALRANVESDDDGIRGSGQRDVGLRDGANTSIDHPQTDLVADVDLGQRVLQGFHRTSTVALEDEPQFLGLALLELLEQLVEGLATSASSLGRHPESCGPPFGDLPRSSVIINDQEAVSSAGYCR